MVNMSDAGGPTYASLTQANPTIINGLAGVDLQTGHQAMMNHTDHTMMNMMNTVGVQGTAVQTMPTQNLATVMPAPSHQQAAPDVKPDTMGDATVSVDRNTLMAVLQFLKKNNMKRSEDLLRQEANFYESVEDSKQGIGGDAEVSSVLSAYKSEGDPAEYEDAYKGLQAFIEKSLDAYKHEVSQVLYPVFVHMYLELVFNGHEEVAKSFLQKMGNVQEHCYREDIHKLSLVTTRDHMTGYQIMDNFRSNQFTVRMSRDTYSHLKRYLTEFGGGPVPRIIHDRLYLDVYEGVPRTRTQVLATAGAQEGEAPKQVNKTKIFYGLLKEPELPNLPMEEEEGEEEGDKPKKKKPKKDALQKSKKNDPNAPPSNRIPLPELREIDYLEKAKAFRDALKRVVLSKDTLPSICFYTFLNASGNITSVDISDDSSMLAYCTSDSQVRVQSITPSKLRCMKSAEQLNDIDKDAGPVYACCFSPDRNLLLTGGEDGTIRLWSMQTWTCLVVYKGHVFAVWDVSFSPYGYYFVSGGHDRTGRLWATDHHQPLRIFAGHFSDVDVVQFHPNSNYVASGSSDRSIRLWDCQSGNCVRVLTGHKDVIDTLAFSPCGRFLASAGGDKRILVWDMSHGHLIAEMASHTSTIYTIAFSRDCNILASGGMDNCVKLWDFSRVLEDNHEDDINVSNNPDIKRCNESLLLGTFPTKNTPVLATHFTRRNVLLAAGPFEG
ncbi:Transcription initiation factor TFIID subunit 5-like 1 [Homarus americanus]|uniref:Transcription initiation factor TFIID subunit 5 n=1 Tax=Homarus americanus TaxID=6706 RepID=A0A8J5N6K0_HOMAM|nr:Transcription initiation factor TFIID subunit 5-like 1 [Homarus americanus]